MKWSFNSCIRETFTPCEMSMKFAICVEWMKFATDKCCERENGVGMGYCEREKGIGVNTYCCYCCWGGSTLFPPLVIFLWLVLGLLQALDVEPHCMWIKGNYDLYFKTVATHKLLNRTYLHFLLCNLQWTFLSSFLGVPFLRVNFGSDALTLAILVNHYFDLPPEQCFVNWNYFLHSISWS